MKSSGEGNANGKIILMGEHAVVYGEAAIAFPFQPTHVTAEITDHIYDELRSGYSVGPLAKAPKSLENIKTLIHQLRHDFHYATSANYNFKYNSRRKRNGIKRCRGGSDLPAHFLIVKIHQ